MWLGVSVENQPMAEKRVHHLLSVPAKTRFLSCEPLIGPLDIPFLSDLDWVIVGGESGNGNLPEDPSVKYGYRSCATWWIENIVEDCRLASVPVFVKQLGTHLARELNLKERTGKDMQEWPEALRVRQFPYSVKAMIQ